MRRSGAWRGTLAVSLALTLGSQLGVQPRANAASRPTTAPYMLYADALTAAQIAQLSATPSQHVIIMLKDQATTIKPVGAQQQTRAALFGVEQAPIVSELKQLNAPNLRTFTLINAISAAVSPAEATRLAANPLVRAVLPDRTISAPKKPVLEPDAVGAPPVPGGSPISGPGGLCNTLEPEALQLMNVASQVSNSPQAQTLLDGNGLAVTGAGVKVGVIADGLDQNVLGFTRPDGTSVWGGPQRDFTGDPAGTPSIGGAEAFGDASSIAAQDMPDGSQLKFDLSKYVNPKAVTLPAPCNIHIRGVAPGATLYSYNVFSPLSYTTISTWVAAIEYAVFTDHVNVLSETFGSQYNPDLYTDPVSLADLDAYNAGVTVTNASGDQGSQNTIGNPATDPWVIAVGATTSLRLYTQSHFGAVSLGSGAAVSDNISSFSSSGFAETGTRTLDLVAPGDLGWALCSTDSQMYSACAGAPIQSFGGTSESGPLTAGVAALVIQAYRSTHQGLNPSPELVRRILMSTADDLHLPPDLQGAGLVNAYRAVQQALSTVDANSPGSPAAAQGSHLLLSNTSFGSIDQGGTAETYTFTVTNTGSLAQTVQPAIAAEAPSGLPDNQQGQSTITLNMATSTPFTYYGLPSVHTDYYFTVPAGMNHLNASIAFDTLDPSHASSSVRLSLFDPLNRLAVYSFPQAAASGFGTVDVHDPMAGMWRAVIWTHAQSGYTGPVQFSWAASARTPLAGSSIAPPGPISLNPGKAQTFVATVLMPSTVGDLSAGIDFPGAANGVALAGAIPVTLRTVAQPGSQFTGVLTGGNGRFGWPTQILEYFINVPAGVHDIAASVDFSNDPSYSLMGVLINPSGVAIDSQYTDQQGHVQLFRRDPQPGQWRLLLVLAGPVDGAQTALPFTATISFNTVNVGSSGIPSSPATHLVAGQTYNATVTVQNTGLSNEVFFLDPRISNTTTLAVPGVSPLIVKGVPNYTAFIAPPAMTSLTFAAQSSVPFNLEGELSDGVNYGQITDAPDVIGTPAVQYATSSYRGTVTLTDTNELPSGFYFEGLSGLPYTIVAGSPTDYFWAYGTGQGFDTSVNVDGGDYWADTVLGTNPNAFSQDGVYVPAGGSYTFHVSITPRASLAHGTTVNGFLYVDTLTFAYFSYGVATTGSTDELQAIPYSYTIQ